MSSPPSRGGKKRAQREYKRRGDEGEDEADDSDDTDDGEGRNSDVEGEHLLCCRFRFFTNSTIIVNFIIFCQHYYCHIITRCRAALLPRRGHLVMA
jgi:hypothetical protein